MVDANEVWTEAHAKRLLETCDKSGLSVAEFARRQGIRAQRLHWWRARLARTPAHKAPTPTSFVPAVVKAPKVMLGRSMVVVIETRSGARIEIADTARVSPPWIGAVVRELERRR